MEYSRENGAYIYGVFSVYFTGMWVLYEYAMVLIAARVLFGVILHIMRVCVVGIDGPVLSCFSSGAFRPSVVDFFGHVICFSTLVLIGILFLLMYVLYVLLECTLTYIVSLPLLLYCARFIGLRLFSG
jgi:hypothetical protein